MKRVLLAASSAALSFALLAGAPASAQDAQTSDAVMAELAELGIDTEGLVLTEEQVLEIQAVTGDAGASEEDKVGRINTILGM